MRGWIGVAGGRGRAAEKILNEIEAYSFPSAYSACAAPNADVVRGAIDTLAAGADRCDQDVA